MDVELRIRMWFMFFNWKSMLNVKFCTIDCPKSMNPMQMTFYPNCQLTMWIQSILPIEICSMLVVPFTYIVLEYFNVIRILTSNINYRLWSRRSFIVQLSLLRLQHKNIVLYWQIRIYTFQMKGEMQIWFDFDISSVLLVEFIQCRTKLWLDSINLDSWS